MHNKQAAEAIIQALGNFASDMPVEERRLLAIKLLERVVEDKAIQYLQRKFNIQGHAALHHVISDLHKLPEALKAEAKQAKEAKLVEKVEVLAEKKEAKQAKAE